MTEPPRIVLAGAGGYGATYLTEIAQLEATGAVELAGVCETAVLGEAARDVIGDRPVGPDLAALLRATGPDIGIVATPIHLHVPMALAVLDAGADLLLEKPPAATFGDWERLVSAAGSPVRQVGFQSLGSGALAELRRLVATGALGRVRHVGAWGAWVRPDSYYRRAGWAGRRTLGGVSVADGVFTNPFAHAVATALAVIGCTGRDDVLSVTAELWRLRDIECDDTAWVRVETRAGIPLVLAATLAADVETEPVIVVRGADATARLHYTQDILEVDGKRRRFERTSPLADLLAHRADPSALLAPLGACGGFMAVLDALTTTPEPHRIPAAAVRQEGTAGDPVRVVPGLAAALRRAAEDALDLQTAGRPW